MSFDYAGETLELVFFRGDDLMTTKITLLDAPENTCYLSIDEEADLTTVARRDDWLNSALALPGFWPIRCCAFLQAPRLSAFRLFG